MAALWVAAFHVDVMSTLKLGVPFANNFFEAGQLGVDFFFVLSGFIISYVHRCDVGNSARAKRFLLKRFFRVYPLLFVAMTIKIALLPFAPGDVLTRRPGFSDLVSSYLLLPQLEKPILSVAWTLRHEMFFYFVFLLVIILGRRFGRWFLFFWVTGIVVANVPRFADKLDVLPAFIFSPYNLEFITGCLIAVAISRVALSVRNAIFLLSVGTIAWMTGWFFAADIAGWPVLAYRSYWAGVFGTTIFAAVSLEHAASMPLPASLLLLGEASYSIYLFHLPIQTLLLVAFTRYTTVNVQMMLSVIGCISVALGVFIWKYLERPMLAMMARH